MAQYKEDTDTYVLEEQLDNDLDEVSIYAGDRTLNTYFNTQFIGAYALSDYSINCISLNKITNIENDNDMSHLAVFDNELTWFTDYASVNSNEVQWCLECGIKVFVDGYGYLESDGTFLVYSDGEYALSNGTYMCSPDLTGFNTGCTYYVTYDSNGDATTGNAIWNDVPSNWYDYSSQNWANIVTVSSGNISYFVWIPRYAYKVTDDGVDVVFVNTDNEYTTDGSTYSSYYNLGAYYIPDAFTFNGVELAGIWVSKYEITDPRNPTGFSATSEKESITIDSITWEGSCKPTDSSTSTIVENSDVDITIVGGGVNVTLTDQTLPLTLDETTLGVALSGGTSYTVTVTTPTYYYDTATFTKTITTAEATLEELCAPDLTGFDLSCTYFVTFSSAVPTIDTTTITTEYNSTLGKTVATNAPTGWYDYTNKNWANIVTIGDDGTASYWVWIPRYEYKVDSDQNICDVVFIKAGKTTADSGYYIPDAFTFNGTNLSGIWVSKYEIEDIKVPNGFNCQISSDSIKILKLVYTSGSSVSSGSMPNSGIAMTVKNSSGTVVKSETITISSSDGYTISGLSAGTYTITLVVPEAWSDPITGATGTTTVTKTVTIPGSVAEANEPDVSGFTSSSGTYAYYVTYSSSSTSGDQGIIGEQITSTSTAPSGWYDYESQNWANIIVSNESLESYYGKTIADVSSSIEISVWVWIPRYEYAVEASSNSIDVVFISSNTTNADSGYYIPDAFTFDGIELSGFWTSKYEISDE